jgi:hypothetical protein
VTGPGGPAGGIAVADPRSADPRSNAFGVVPFDTPSGAVIGESLPSNGRFAVADPRPAGFRDGRKHFEGGGHYGVVAWDEAAGTVSGSASHDNGRNCVADPREAIVDGAAVELPKPNDRLVARIVARDGTWHRPFSTLELAALQSLFDPEEVFAGGFDLEGGSDATKREWIGNAVPSAAARGMADTIGETLLLAQMGETFMLSSRGIWVKPLALALAVDNHQPIIGLDGDLPA